MGRWTACVSRSASYAYRVAASISEHNRGLCEPHVQMFALLGIEAGSHCRSGLARRDETRKRQAEVRTSKDAKRRRKHRSKAKHRGIVLSEQSEKVAGFDQYQSGMRIDLTLAQTIEPDILILMIDLYAEIEAQKTHEQNKKCNSISADKTAATAKSQQKCKCGSATHLRTSHSNCPLNPRKKQ